MISSSAFLTNLFDSSHPNMPLNDIDSYDQDTEENDFHQKVANRMLLLSFPTFLVLHYIIPAPFGKHTPESNVSRVKSWLFGFRFSARVSWFLWEIPNLIWVAISLPHIRPDILGEWNVEDGQTRSIINANTILLTLFTMHYINRTILYPLRMSPKSQPVPLVTSMAGFAFTSCNGYLQTKHLCQFHKFPNDRHFQPSFLFSILIFLTGFFINLHSDSILRNLRNQCKGYQIPRDGMFRYVSGANHFGEILEWFGYALASDFTTPTLAFFMYTCGNLIPRALSTHTWYLQKFEDYPKNRKAVLPFIF